MSKYLTEFDEIQAAFKRVKLNENCMVYRNGILLENQDSYNKIQKLLNTPEMCEAHRYLYDLDVECLSEDEIQRVDKLFDLGVKKGYIDNSFEEELEKSENPDAIIADEQPTETITNNEQPVEDFRKVPIPCWTILYSATKNGETKCGECYSNAISVSAAKADCLAKLERFGYGNVSILAIEAGDSDCVQMTEDDMLKNRHHNMHIAEATENNLLEDEGSDDAGSDEGSDDEGSDDEGSDDEGSDDEGSDDEGSDEGSDDEGSDDEGSDEGSDDEGSDDAGSDEGSDDEGSDDETKELSDEEKAALKDEYKAKFRDVMLSCEFEGKSFVDLTIPEKVKFFEKLASEWTQVDPKEFMSEEEQDQLESIVVNQQ